MPPVAPNSAPPAAVPAVPSSDPKSSGFQHFSISAFQRFLPLAAFGILWLDLIRFLSSQWEAREQYAYGWFVPFFAVALLWRRWVDRPLTTDHGPQDQRTEDGGQKSVVSSQLSVVRSPFLLSAFCFLLLFLLLPLRVIYEINRDWPLVSWLYSGIVVFLTLYAIRLADPALNSQLSTLSSSAALHLAGPPRPSPLAPHPSPQSVVSGQ